MTISPVPTSDPSRTSQSKTSQTSHQKISGTFIPTPAADETTVRSFYPTLRSSSKSTQSSQSTSEQVTQHIHILSPVPVPQLKPHQIAINLPPPDIQRIVQNPSPLLPSQSRVIVTAKASISDESGRPLNTTQLVTLPLPTIPASYDDYKEGDESFDPFYRDVPKIRNARRSSRRIIDSKIPLRHKRSTGQTKSSMVSFVYGGDTGRRQHVQVVDISEKEKNREKVAADDSSQDFRSIKESLIRFRDILFSGDFTDDMIRNVFEGSSLNKVNSGGIVKTKSTESLEDLETKASKYFKTKEHEDEEETRVNKEKDAEVPMKLDTKESDVEEYIDLNNNKENESKIVELDISESEKTEALEASSEVTEAMVQRASSQSKKNESNDKRPQRVLEVVILDPNEYLKMKSSDKENPENVTEEKLTPTEIPIVSTTEHTTEATLIKDDTDKTDFRSSKKDNDEAVATEQPAKVEINEGKVSEEESKTEKSKEQVQPRQSAKRRRYRMRSVGTKVVKSDDNKMQNDEPAKVMERKVIEETTTTTSAPDIISEVDQINKHIFDEPESQTSKEVDTRAVGHHNSYAKSLQTGKDQSMGKENRKNQANEYEASEKGSKNLKKDEEKVDKVIEVEEKSTAPTLDVEEIEKHKKPVEELEENISMEEKNYSKEESIEHESREDESTTVFSKEDSKEDPEEDSGSVRKVNKTSRGGKSMKFDDSFREISTHRQDNRKFSSDEEEEKGSQDYSTIKSEEITSREVSSEYHDSMEAFYENSQEVEDDYRDSEGLDKSTISSEHRDSEEISGSKEDAVEEHDESESTSSEQEDSTEGVLKFTDELPKDKKEDVSDSKKSPESDENIAHDYVDDNYEPDNYKEREFTDTDSLSNDKINKEMDSGSEESSEDEPKTTTDSQKEQNEESEKETGKFEDSGTQEVDMLQTTTSSTTTTTTTTTTTPRPPPKLFKPISARKNYNYVPPTTTPNPVVIKPRHSLLNPKPAKPLKSYNELAPKPVIRKFPLLARKTTTAASTTIREDDSTESTELPMTTMEVPVTVTEAGRSEENALEVKLDKDQEKDVKKPMQKDQSPEINKDDQDPSPSEQKSPTNLKKDEKNLTKESENFTPYPITRLSTLASTIEDTLKEVESTSTETEKSTTARIFTLVDVEILSTTAQPITSTSNEPEPKTERGPDHAETTTAKAIEEEASTTSSTKSSYQETTEVPSTLPTEPSTSSTEPSTSSTEPSTSSTDPLTSSTEPSTTIQSTSTEAEQVESTTTRWLGKSVALRRKDGFNCLEKEMYRFYGDTRDCRLFHYCSPGFTSRQVLDFRFVCEEGTAFDEKSQSCRHDVRESKCPNRQW